MHWIRAAEEYELARSAADSRRLKIPVQIIQNHENRGIRSSSTGWCLRAHWGVMTIGELQADLEVRENLLVVIASGTVSYPAAHSLLEQLLDTAKQHRMSRIFVDTLAVEGQLTPQDRRHLGRALAAYVALDRSVQMAFVGKPTAGQGVTVARNCGVVIEKFSTRQDALKWLEGTGAGASS